MTSLAHRKPVLARRPGHSRRSGSARRPVGTLLSLFAPFARRPRGADAGAAAPAAPASAHHVVELAFGTAAREGERFLSMFIYWLLFEVV